MKTIGILGGTRFIGYHLAHRLVLNGHKVTLFNRGKTLPPGSVKGCKKIIGDRNNPTDLEKFFCESYDVVFDLSGYTPLQISPIAEKHSSKLGHYIFCSTSSVLHSGSGTYGQDKALIEKMLETSIEIGNKSTIVRPQGVFGNYDFAHAGYIFSCLHSGAPIKVIKTKLERKINLLFVDDLINVFIHIMDNSKTLRKVYNVAGDDVISLNGLIKSCGEIAGLQPQLQFVDAESDMNPNLFWHSFDLILDNESCKTDLGIKFTPLKEAIERVWRLNDYSQIGQFRKKLKNKIRRLVYLP